MPASDTPAAVIIAFQVSPLAPTIADDHLPDHVAAEHRGEVEEVVAARESLQRRTPPCRRPAPAPARCRSSAGSRTAQTASTATRSSGCVGTGRGGTGRTRRRARRRMPPAGCPSARAPAGTCRVPTTRRWPGTPGCTPAPRCRSRGRPAGPARLAGSRCSEKVRLSGVGWKMFAFQRSANDIWPPSIARTPSATHAMIHMLSSESPRSAGTSRPRPAAIGHVITTVSGDVGRGGGGGLGAAALHGDHGAPGPGRRRPGGWAVTPRRTRGRSRPRRRRSAPSSGGEARNTTRK